MVVENVYGRLKGRFRSIAKRLDLNVETVCLDIAACCVLHNFFYFLNFNLLLFHLQLFQKNIKMLFLNVGHIGRKF